MTVSPVPSIGENEAPSEAAAAYMAMLRRIHELSGLTAGQIAAFSGLPRSTAYRFVDRKNTTLPKNRNQVEIFLRACRLPQRSLDRMLELWDDVSGKPPSRDTPADGLALEKSAAEGLVPQTDAAVLPGWQEWDDEDPLPGRATLRRRRRRSVPASATHSQPPEEDDLLMPVLPPHGPHSHDDSCLCLDLIQRLQVPHQSSEATRAQLVLLRFVPVVMLILALYPLGAAVWFGHLLTGGFTGIISAAVAIGLLLIIASRAHRCGQHLSNLTPTGLLAGALGGICSGLLAWAAVPTVPTAVLTGFVVFTMSPSWFSLTRWPGINTVHGAFAVITALWCGTTVGTAAGYTGFPLTGSVLIGVLGAATAIAVLCSNGPHTEQSAWTKLTLSPPMHPAQGAPPFGRTGTPI